MILITATGRDRPGMVAALTQKVFEAKCNIEDATMTRLSGEFAMILVVAPPPDLDAATLSTRLSGLKESHGLTVQCNDFEGEDKENADAARSILSVYGGDQAGLVARISSVLAAYGVNITDLQTRMASDRQVYVMIYEVELPPALDVTVLQKALDEESRQLQVHAVLRPLEEDTL